MLNVEVPLFAALLMSLRETSEYLALCQKCTWNNTCPPGHVAMREDRLASALSSRGHRRMGGVPRRSS